MSEVDRDPLLHFAAYKDLSGSLIFDVVRAKEPSPERALEILTALQRKSDTGVTRSVGSSGVTVPVF